MEKTFYVPVVVLAYKVCPANLEATIFATLIATSNIGFSSPPSLILISSLLKDLTCFANHWYREGEKASDDAFLIKDLPDFALPCTNTMCCTCICYVRGVNMCEQNAAFCTGLHRFLGPPFYNKLILAEFRKTCRQNVSYIAPFSSNQSLAVF